MNTPKFYFDELLPISSHRLEIVQSLAENQVVVIAGETGSGKTTQLPKMCLQAGLAENGLIGCTQPRRIAARSVAERVAEEMEVATGGLVGYQVRFQERLGPQTRVKFMTDGILLAESQHDPLLRKYSCLIIDEAHERSLNIDFLLGYLRRLLPRRPDLKLIITSATIDTGKFARHFNLQKKPAPVIEVSGRGYPVELRYRPLEREDGKPRELNQAIYAAITELDRTSTGGASSIPGDVLVFLSGERDIREAGKFLGKSNLRETEVLPLLARLSSAEQQKIFHPGAKRRIILATNIAETSLTVPRINAVIDSGLARISRYSTRSRVLRLPVEPISQASANQRSGRCGRLGPGVCIRLFAEDDFNLREEFTQPEILRTSLASVILRMTAMDLGAIEDFPFVDQPLARSINDAWNLLLELAAVDRQRKITKLGKHLAHWPVDVRIGRMLLAAGNEGCVDEMLTLAAVLSIQDPRERPLEVQQAADEKHAQFKDTKSDFVSLLKLWQWLLEQRKTLSNSQFRKSCQRNFLAWHRVREWTDLRRQLAELAKEAKLPLNKNPANYTAIHKALLAGLLSHIGLKDENHQFQGARGTRFMLFPGSALFKKPPQWVMAAELVETSRLFARVNAGIDPQWLEQVGGHLLKTHEFDPHWSRRQGRVIAWQQVSLYGLVIVEKRRVDFALRDPQQAREIFLRDGLVANDINTRAGFAQSNQLLIAEVSSHEDKRRSHDVLVDEKVLFDFFDARLPESINSVKTLEKWLQGLGSKERDVLLYSRDLLVQENAGLAAEDEFPEFLSLAGQQYELIYCFDPRDARDGVSFQLPLHQLNTLEDARLQWLVPGLLREKVIALIKTLAKPLRRGLTPAPQFADAFLQRAGYQSEQALLSVLSDEFSAISGLEIVATDWDESRLDKHLRFNIQLTDKSGVIEESRSLKELKQQFGIQARQKFMHREGREWHRDGLKEWNFGDVPGTVQTPGGSKAWPALVDQKNGVGLRLFDNPAEANTTQQAGITRLLLLKLTDKLKYLRKNSGLSQATKMIYLALSEEGHAKPAEDLLLSVLNDLVSGFGNVRSESQFDQLAALVAKQWVPECNKLAQVFNQVMLAYQQAGLQVDTTLAKRFPAVWEDVSSQLEDMVYAGFLEDVDAVVLRQYPRYLEAIAIRLQRLAQDPEKDAVRMQQAAPFWQRYLQWLEEEGTYTPELDNYRWLLEEFRVSLFAQELGTQQKVSIQRLEKAWALV
ncbi:MAG: ATP-dependent RNA helicase HrpA [Xanthomonadales bacterium]|nr:ATP-dependent RNA helicase HrpA [Xanthomonadales bacterium]